MLDTDLQSRFRFFLGNAGYSVPPGRAVCALALARIERAAEELQDAGRLRISWEQEDTSPVDIFMDDDPAIQRIEEGRYDWMYCVLYLDDEVVTSLGGITLDTHGRRSFGTWSDGSGGFSRGGWSSDPYARVVEAELASEADIMHILTEEIGADEPTERYSFSTVSCGSASPIRLRLLLRAPIGGEMSDETYNGWTNYQTWNVTLWMDSEEPTYNLARSMARDAASSETPRVDLADALKEFHANQLEALYPDIATGASVFSDLMGHALDSVNWHEIATNYLEELKDE